MEKPDNGLYDKNYSEDWKSWINWWLRHNDYITAKQAVQGTMKETRGLINPNWIIQEWEKVEIESRNS